METNHPSPVAGPRPDGDRRPPLAAHERKALALVLVATLGFMVHGVVNEVNGTVEYAITIGALVVLLCRLRTRVLPGYVVYAAAASATVHLAGGLLRVRGGALYNFTPGPEVLRYDHFGHALGIAVGAFLVWELMLRDVFATTGRRCLVTVTTLAALGLGAIVEMIEFIATNLHESYSVGGYTNTGWDLVTNTLAGILAGLLIHHRSVRGNTDRADSAHTTASDATGVGQTDGAPVAVVEAAR